MEEPIGEVQLTAGAAFEITPVSHDRGNKDKFPRESTDFADPDSPSGPKRRKMNSDTPSSVSSFSSRSASPGAGEWLDDSQCSTPGGSPAPRSLAEFKRHYRKDELWRAIESNYHYLMDKEIIEACQSTESDLSLEDEDFAGQPTISFAEFLKEYQELFHWLDQIKIATQRPVTSLSEKYLNQTYHEELLDRSPRRKLFNDCAKQLLKRSPHLKDELNSKVQHLNILWQTVEQALTPKHGYQDLDTMLKDLECDLTSLRKWLNSVELHLRQLTIKADWTEKDLEQGLKDHQVLQRDIESHSKIVSAVLKLSERLEHDQQACTKQEHRDSLQLVALNLERRWHGIWLQSLEWQCRLEEASSRRKGIYGSSFNFSRFHLPALDESGQSDLCTDLTNGSLIDLGDDSFLFLGSQRERFTDTPSFSDSSGTSPAAIGRLTAFLDKSSGDSANISEAESKMEDSCDGMENFDWPLFHSSDAEMEGRPVKKVTEVKDIGYSSESQSNDETEMRLQMLENKFRGICQVASDIPLPTDRFSQDSLSRPGHQGYYCMTTVDVDTTDRTDGDEAPDTKDDDHSDFMSKDEVQRSSEWKTEEASLDIGLPVAEQTLAVGADAASSEQSGAESATESKEKIKELIERAEDLVRSPNSPVKTPPEQKDIAVAKKAQETETSNTGVESSCDASGEETSDNESSADEFSTATDDGRDTLFDSVICLTSDSRNTSRENLNHCLSPNSQLTFDTVRLRQTVGVRRGGKDRPWSVIDLEDINKALDCRQFSTSESAIDRLAKHQTDTDTPALPNSQFHTNQSATFPRNRTRGRGFRRSVSTSSQNSPRGAKRKLKYPSPSKTAPHSNEYASTDQFVPSKDSFSSDEDGNKQSTSETEDMVQMFEMARVKSSSSGSTSGESDTETSDEYETPPVEPVTSDNEDVLNSTGSFSENAWDNYQPLYPSVSDDPTEEKLQWEVKDDELEFDEEFQDFQGSSIIKEALKRNDKKPKPLPVPTSAHIEDSDSDIDDFHYILDQSHFQLKIADQSLQKRRKDHWGTGLGPQTKYAEIMATCDTNIKCLESIGQHLMTTDVTEEDIDKMHDLLYQWQKLQSLASDRQIQAQQLASITTIVTDVKTRHKEVEKTMATESFSSVEDLKNAIQTLESHQSSLKEQEGQLTAVEEELTNLGTKYPVLTLDKVSREMAVLKHVNTELFSRVMKQLKDSRRKADLWYEYLEGKKELEYLLNEDRQRLQRLFGQRQAGTLVSKRDVVQIVESLQSNLSVYESKLTDLQLLHSRLPNQSDEKARCDFLASLADLKNQLFVMTKYCRDMTRDIEEDEDLAIEETDFGQLEGPVAALHETVLHQSSRKRSVSHLAESNYSSSWSLLGSYPVHIAALILLTGLIYLMDPDIIENLTNFSIRISPELKYVDGPPPI